ncbi:plasmid mobilization relaxosome protein MobC [Neorhizobium lilium]|uniref:Plasmid mobilization relaxosome protein MobC n=1 Tax=Neorhizobium lilium TaxID=2503024 RepID=A0A444LDS9_9HYPH|nr:plasmid mobilization relaxosome protein MobC [Neorhizobium lilium]RWX75959.1 plasmid mobilization relaxosome protein MobC [Neorhizobium lilium]
MRDQTIRIRATREETATMKDLAIARGLTLSDLVRRAALGVRMPVRSLATPDAALLGRLLGELGRVGGNLNQLVRRANSGKLVGHDVNLSLTLAELDTLRAQVREIIV